MNKQDLIKTTRLARLKLSEEEAQEFTEQLQSVFKHFNQIASIDTKGITPLVYPLEGLVSLEPLRKDLVQKGENKEVFLSLAPERLGNEYKVPPVMD
ncbi:MAG: Asp-tRNA(Asn)/Glu-tRNA(Gln) amidotransferase subunit GatC [Oligoflexia bacterium]|nr:Asp-tRNA(Asn)/Glu-tRNA(Gln) amidotransferase subunit GatC [Bdellovibrionales bacterium]MYE07632.1 Asp-tRNA(Asn)/Glu-tRNA(Gln) amidotransferase subunit GatC [Oligoflexia bacterium]